MSVQSLIAKWDEALVEVQLAADGHREELSNQDLEAAEAPGIGAKYGLRAGCSPASCPGTYCDTCGIFC